MNPEDYKAEREKRGTQAAVAALLRVDPQTISRRERGEIPITPEAALALISLPKSRRRRRPQNGGDEPRAGSAATPKEKNTL